MSATDLIGQEFTYAVAGRFPDGVPGIVEDVQHLGVIENSVSEERHRAVRFLLRLRDCDDLKDLRPYGSGGSPVCFDCMKASLDREVAAGAAFGALLDAAVILSEAGVAVVDEEGPRPFDSKEAS